MDIDHLRRLAEHNIHVFLKLYGIKNERGDKLDFKNHLFLVDPFEDLSPFQVCQKSSQVGWSTLAIIKTLYVARMKNWSLAYTLPTASDAQEFVRTKVNRIIQANPILKSFVDDGDNLSDKRVGNANIFYRGSFMERAAISFTTDLNVYDEVDRSDQQVLATYASRLQHSTYKGEWAFSNPSVAGNGVSRFWEESDQKHWFVRCEKCHKDQYLSWPDSVCFERVAYQCKHCHTILPDETRRKGRWVKRWNDGRKFSGYWVSSLMAPWIPASYVLDQYLSKPIDYFFNFILGLPYIGEGNKVTPEMFYRGCTSTVNSQENVVIGCDSGIKKHYVLGNREGVFHAGVTETWDTIRGFLHQYPRSVAVIDALPDLTEPRKLREEFKGRVFLCHYVRDRKTFQTIRWGEGDEAGNVNVDRNRTMQVLIDELADGRVALQGTRDDWARVYEHFDSLYRMEEKDAAGNPFFKWETSNGQDHWCHAMLYLRVGLDRFGHDKIITSTTPLPERFKEGYEETVTRSGEWGVEAPDPKKVFRMRHPTDWRL